MRKLWIVILSGVALLIGNFALVRCIHREQPCYYGPPIEDPTIDTLDMRMKEKHRQELRERIEAIRDILEERQNAEVYGSPEIMEEYAKETQRYRIEADSLENELKALDEE